MSSTEPVVPPSADPHHAAEAQESVSPAESMAPAQPAPAAPVLDPAACAAQLRQRWPALFSGSPKPIKLRIHADLQQRAPGVFGKPVLSAFFRRYTSTTSYLLAVSRGGPRFDLDGQPSGEVSAEHRQVAKDELERRRGNQETRRALEDEQRRNRAGLLRDFEGTTLTRSNFCALKGVAEDELDGLLAMARTEAAQRPAPDPRGPDRHRRATGNADAGRRGPDSVGRRR